MARTAKMAIEVVDNALTLYETLRKQMPISFYQPSPKQDAFHRSTSIIRALKGGNQSGKTHAGAAEDHAIMCGFRPWVPKDDPSFRVKLGDGRPMPIPCEMRIVVPDFRTALMTTFIPKFLDLAPLGAYRLIKDTSGYYVECRAAWGSVAYFMSHEQDVRKFESGTGHAVHWDEPPPRPIRVAAKRGLMRHAGLELFTYTPVYEEYLEQELEDRADGVDITMIEIETEDNLIENGGVLSAAGYKSYLDTLSPLERQMRLHGRRAGRIARCVPDYQDTEPWLCDPFNVPESWPRVLVVDPHERKPDCLVWTAFHPDGNSAYVFDEVMDERSQGGSSQTSRCIESREHETGGRYTLGLIDPRFAEKNQRESGMTVQEELAAAGVYLTKAPGLRLEEGYRRLSEWFRLNKETGKPYLRVFRNLPRVRESLLRTRWPMKNGMFLKGAGVQGADDQASCLRYLRCYGVDVNELLSMKADMMIPDAENLLDDFSLDNSGGSHTGY